MKKTFLFPLILLLLCGTAYSWPWGGGAGTPDSGPGSGTVTSVSGSSMIGVATGTTTPALSLTDNSITSAKLLDNTIASLKLLDNTIASTKLLDNTIAGSKLNANISIATLGLINGKIAFIDNVSGPTDVQMHGQWNLVNEAITVLLPTAVGGMHGCIQDTGAAHDIIVDVQGTDTMTLVGVEGAGGVGITNAAGASTGDYICVLATGTNKWTATFSRGTWASQ